jgi:hypothetical protein
VGEPFVTVFTTEDPIQGQILVDLLAGAGIRASLLGTRHGALIGVAQNILGLRLEVPAGDAERAHELIDGFLRAEPADDHDPDVREPGASAAGRRSALLAAGCTFIVPGGSHFYARRPWTGLLLALGLAAAFVGMAGGSNVESTCAALAFAGLVGCDLAGGQRAVRALNREETASRTRQLLSGLAMVALTFGLAYAVGTHLPPPRIP